MTIMNKKYFAPEINIVEVCTHTQLLAGSGGVETDSGLGNAFTGTDVTYSREFDELFD